jgi:hypothetical protein
MAIIFPSALPGLCRVRLAELVVERDALYDLLKRSPVNLADAYMATANLVTVAVRISFS